MTTPDSFGLSNLTKPATVLIEKISDAVGGIARPWQIRRTALAQADADVIAEEGRERVRLLKIRAETLSDYEARASLRLINQETSRQKNIESISQMAAGLLDESAKPDQLERDWLTDVMEKCKDISDVEMQSLWSRIIAGEANGKGSFSKRTIATVSTFDKSDAAIFSQFCSSCWMIGNPCVIIANFKSDVYERRKINFSVLKHLDDIGLLRLDSLGGFVRSELPREFSVFYFGTQVDIILPIPEGAKGSFPVGNVLLSRTGSELAKICGAQRDDELMEHTIGWWQAAGITAVVN